jgi:hypothetical protein
MKKIITFLCLFGIACSASSTGQQQTLREIIIVATNPTPPILKSAPVQPVKAWVIGTQLKFEFQSNLGTVTLTITHNASNETVYQTTGNATNGTEWLIPTVSWASGDYTITIIRSNGQTFTGEFEL